MIPDVHGLESKAVLRGLAWVILLAAALAGCTGSDEQAGAPTEMPPAPLPAPRSNNPANNIGATAVLPPQGPDESDAAYSWKRECVRQWSSQAYTFRDPPLVRGGYCLYYPTSDGTLYWTILPGNQSYMDAWQAGAMPRADGFFDWVVPLGHEVDLVENGTAPRKLLDLDFYHLPGVVAFRHDDGTVHALVQDDGPETQIPNVGTSSSPVFHYIWTNAAGTVSSQDVIGRSLFRDATLRSDGVFDAFYTVEGLLASTLYMGTSGPLQPTPLPGYNLFDIDVHEGTLYGCAGGAGGYYLLEWRLGEAASIPMLELAIQDAAAPLSFACSVAVSDLGPVLVVANTSSDCTRGDRAATRTAAGWQLTKFDFCDAYGSQDLATRRGVPFYTGNSGSGTATGNWKVGTPVFAPDGGDPTASWRVVWGAYGGRWFIQDRAEERLLLTGESLINPPFQFPWFSDEEDHGVTWGVIDIPADSLASIARAA